MDIINAMMQAHTRFLAARKQASKIEALPTYLAAIKGSVGSNQYRSVFVARADEDFLVDVCNDGELSGAYYVSALLASLNFIGSWHATIPSVLRDMQKCGWVGHRPSQGKLHDGAVLVWNKIPNRHIGFYVGKGSAVSVDYKLGQPQRRDWKKEEVSEVWHPPSLYR